MNRSKGEEIYGAHAALETYSSDVPNWELGEFIDDEMWVGLGGTGKGAKWVEGGTTTPGEFENAYTPDYFMAREYGYENYYEYDYKEASPGFKLNRSRSRMRSRRTSRDCGRRPSPCNDRRGSSCRSRRTLQTWA